MSTGLSCAKVPVCTVSIVDPPQDEKMGLRYNMDNCFGVWYWYDPVYNPNMAKLVDCIGLIQSYADPTTVVVPIVETLN